MITEPCYSLLFCFCRIWCFQNQLLLFEKRRHNLHFSFFICIQRSFSSLVKAFKGPAKIQLKLSLP